MSQSPLRIHVGACLEGHRDLVSRIIKGITRVTIWVIGVIVPSTLQVQYVWRIGYEFERGWGFGKEWVRGLKGLSATSSSKGASRVFLLGVSGNKGI